MATPHPARDRPSKLVPTLQQPLGVGGEVPFWVRHLHLDSCLVHALVLPGAATHIRTRIRTLTLVRCTTMEAAWHLSPYLVGIQAASGFRTKRALAIQQLVQQAAKRPPIHREPVTAAITVSNTSHDKCGTACMLITGLSSPPLFHKSLTHHNHGCDNQYP